MRKVIVGTFVSLDGVMQAPGGPNEDTSGGFRFGGWLVPHMDATTGAAVGELFEKPFDLLLGRRTYDIFAGYWPYVQKDTKAKDYDAGTAEMGRQFDKATKHVATHRAASLGWQNSKALGEDIPAAINALKKTSGPDLVVQGSGGLIHQLLASDLVDVIQLLIFPVVLGKGRRLFDGNEAPAGLKLVKSDVSSSGVILARYERAGEVKTGSFIFENPNAA
jgi:dihydrofolate reductase